MDITNCARLQQQTRLRHISQGIYNYIPSCGSNMRIRSFMKCFSPKADSAATEPYFPVFLRNVRYHAACTYNELWPCQIVRFWVPCKIPDWLMRHHEVLSDSKNKQCSVMFRNTLLRYFANNLYIPVLFTYRFFCDTLRLSVLIKLIFWAASAMTDIVSVSVIVEPLLPSLDFLRYLSNIQSCIITSGIRLVATIVTIVNHLAPSRNITIVY